MPPGSCRASAASIQARTEPSGTRGGCRSSRGGCDQCGAQPPGGHAAVQVGAATSFVKHQVPTKGYVLMTERKCRWERQGRLCLAEFIISFKENVVVFGFFFNFICDFISLQAFGDRVPWGGEVCLIACDPQLFSPLELAGRADVMIQKIKVWQSSHH